MIVVRDASPADHDAIWQILEPVIPAGETYALPRDLTKEQCLAYWFGAGHRVFVAVEGMRLVGTYFLCANYQGGGAHVANCGYMTANEAARRGVATAMCEHSLEEARKSGFRAMQFNFVVSTNERAIRLWHRLGFEVVGRLTEAFLHPNLGYVDALVMHRKL
jgi:ribosomal protein S18 acetylase RimI-like enzyme